MCNRSYVLKCPYSPWWKDNQTWKFFFRRQIFRFHTRLLWSQGLLNFFTKLMSSNFKTLIDQGFALVYIDNILLFLNSKEDLFTLIEQLHLNSTKHELKLSPEKSFFMLLKVKFLGHEISYITTKPVHSKIAAIHKLPSPPGKIVSFLRSSTWKHSMELDTWTWSFK